MTPKTKGEILFNEVEAANANFKSNIISTHENGTMENLDDIWLWWWICWV